MDKPLCPVRALRACVRPTAYIRWSGWLFLYYGKGGGALSRQRLYHLIVDAINHAYSSTLFV